MQDWRELENYLARGLKNRIIAAVPEAASVDGSNGIPQKDWPYARAYYPVSCQTSQHVSIQLLSFHEQSRSDKGQWLG